MHKLEYLKCKFSNMHKQGTDEWLQSRMFSFGGSEIGTLLNKNRYKTRENLFRDKINKVNETDDPRHWGNLFEPVAKIFICIQRKCEIHDFGSIPHPYYPICYSPDGVMVEGDDLVLLEIKNPIWRGVGVVQENYQIQVKTGMCILPVKHCLFAQFRFRRCPIYTDPHDKSFDRDYHRESVTRAKPKTPILFGYMYWDGPEELIDLGSVPEIYKHTLHQKSPRIILNEIFHPITGMVLMFKLFEVSYEIIPAEPDFLSKQDKTWWTYYKELCDQIKAKKI